jgi:hypothetical protein
VVLLLQIDVLGEMSAGKQPATSVLDHVQDSHRLLVIGHEDDMINFVNEEQKQQVTCHWLLSLIAIYEKMFCIVVM